MSVLVQISDPHFGTERAPVVEALVRLVHASTPELVVLSGDITQRATPAQFEAARVFTERLRAPALLVIPGNHDVPLFNLAARAVSPYARYRAAFGRTLEPEHVSPRWFVVGVKTTRRWRHADGSVSAKQVEHVARRLATATREQMRIVVVHQPVAVPVEAEAKNLLHGHAAAIRRWADAGADAVLGGHIHLPCVLPLHERQPDLSRPLWAVQAGTAVSTRIRHEAGNSVNLIRHDGAGTAVVERWDYDDASDRFAVRARHDLRLSRAP